MTPDAVNDLAAINAALSLSTQQCVESMGDPDPKRRRGVDFALLDRALAATERMVEELGPDVPVPGRPHDSPAGLRQHVREVLASAEVYRPKVRRA